MRSWKNCKNRKKWMVSLFLTLFLWHYIFIPFYPSEVFSELCSQTLWPVISLLLPNQAMAGIAPNPEDYTINQIPANFVDISSSGLRLSLADEAGIEVPIGFPFSFFGTIFTAVTISANGYLTFLPQLSPFNQVIPEPNLPNALIAPFWDDLNPGHNPAGGIFYQTMGLSPNRVLLVQWDKCPLKADPDSRLTFEVILFEGSHEIQFQYLSMLAGGLTGGDATGSGAVSGKSATIGLENEDGTKGNKFSCNREGAVKNGSAISFTLGGNAFEEGQLLGDLDHDREITILDHSQFTDHFLEEVKPKPSSELLWLDLSPSPGLGERSFGDGMINLLDQALVFEVIMGRKITNPVLSNSSWSMALPGESLTLIGSGFSLVAGQNKIIFIDLLGHETEVLADWVNAEGTRLSLTVPLGLEQIVALRVEQAGQMSNSLLFVLEGKPLISTITPASGMVGDTIWLKGYGFDQNPTDNLVSFNGQKAQVINVLADGAASVLKVTVPQGALSGPVTVSVDGQVSNGLHFTLRQPLEVSITSPLADSEITAPVAITGTVWDAHLDYYLLAYAPAGSSTFTEFTRHTSTIEDGVLGIFDPTLIDNGLYTIKLTAYDLAGNYRSTEVQYLVRGKMKLGIFTLSFRDLEIPLAGIPIQVYRTYDTKLRHEKGDFGFGWILSVKAYPKVHKNRPEGEAWVQNSSGGTWPTYTLDPLANHLVSVTLPDQRVMTFDFTPKPDRQSFIPISVTQAKYTARPGTIGKLEPVGETELLVDSAGGLYTYDGDLYNPQNFKLTLEDGSAYYLIIGQGVNKIVEKNGHQVEFRPEGIIHSSGRSILFTRDAQGRITAITDPVGNSLSYIYDSDGNLVKVTDQLGYETRFTYLPNHYLEEIIDPRGLRGIRNHYDQSGRLIAIEDAEGNRTEFVHNLEARQEVIEDRRGNVTIHEFDSRGNITAKIDALGHRWEYTYDQYDHKLSETDPLGHTHSYAYDGQGHLIKETDPLGNITEKTYDASGRLIQEKNHLGLTRSVVYDAKGNISQSKDWAGQETIYTYSAAGFLLSEKNALGYLVSNAYDAHGNLISQTNALGHSESYTYDALGRKLTTTTTRTTASGQVVTMTQRSIYDAAGHLIEDIDFDGLSTKTEYNPLGKKSAIIDKMGHRTSFVYDERGNLITITYPDGTTEEYQYDEEGNKIFEKCQSCSGQGGEIRFVYDALNQKIKTLNPDGSENRIFYDPSGQIIRTIDENGQESQSINDALGRQVKIIDSLGNETEFQYDSLSRKIALIDPLGRITRFEYNANGLQTKTIFPDGTCAEVQYDALGRKITEIDQAGKSTHSVYNPVGQLIEITDPAGGKTKYQYDELGHKIAQIDANGRLTKWEYDNLGRIVKRTLPLGMSETSTYDVNDNLLSKTDFNGLTITYQYDVKNRLTRKTYPDGQWVAYTYTQAGRTESVTDARGRTDYEYNESGQLISLLEPDGVRVQYTYDALGNRLTLATAHSTSRSEYDALKRLVKVIDQAGGETTYLYDAVGNRTGIIYPNGSKILYQYDNLNRLILLENRDAQDSLLTSYRYTLGPSGIKLKLEENTGRVVNYQYDDLYRLIQEEIHDPASGAQTIAYTYDAFGNRLTKTEAAGTTTYSYDQNDRLLLETGPGKNIQYTYDLNGNLISKVENGLTTSYTFDYENHLTGVQTSESSVAYVYDFNGIKIERWIGSTKKRFVSDKNRSYSQVIEELDQNGQLLAAYVYGDHRISLTVNGATYYYLHDGTLSTRALIDVAGAITDTWVYDAFGLVRQRTGSTPNSFLFDGEEYDANSGFYYLRARWMNPTIGRFVSLDPYVGSPFEPQSLHKYVFAHNNPLSYHDPSGLVASLTDMVIINIMIGLIAKSYSIAINMLVTGNIVTWQQTLWELAVTTLSSAITAVMFGAGAMVMGNAVGGAATIIESLLLRAMFMLPVTLCAAPVAYLDCILTEPRENVSGALIDPQGSKNFCLGRTAFTMSTMVLSLVLIPGIKSPDIPTDKIEPLLRLEGWKAASEAKNQITDAVRDWYLSGDSRVQEVFNKAFGWFKDSMLADEGKSRGCQSPACFLLQ